MNNIFLNGGILKRQLSQFIGQGDIYPVIIGGTTVKRCTNSTQYEVPFTDIDLKFVIAGKDTPEKFKKALEMREMFFKNMMADSEMDTFKKTYNIDFVLSKIDETIHGRRQFLEVINFENNSKYVLIDTMILTENTFEYYHNYKNFLQPQKKPFLKQIPFKIIDGIPYSTCNWTYFDTVRMLYSSKVSYEQNKASFFLNKYIKYLAKFIAMYSYINRTNNKKLFNIFLKLNQDDKIKYFKSNEYLIQKTIDENTNLKSLINKFVAIPKYNDVSKNILHFILKKVLGKYMKHYKHESYYPIISGGANLTRCKDSKLKVKDIDIFFIYDCDFKTIFQKRSEFLNDIITDEDLLNYLDNYKSTHNIKVKCSIYVPDVEASEISKLSLSNIIVDIYNLNNDFLYKNAIIDCSLLEKFDKEVQIYKKHNGIDLRDPIPYIRQRNVFFATCSFLEFNARMMIYIFKDKFKKEKTIRNFTRLVKYISKLYILNGDSETANQVIKLSYGTTLSDQNSTYISNERLKLLNRYIKFVFSLDEMKKIKKIYASYK